MKIKDREDKILCPFFVGVNCVRPRAFTECPYEIDDFAAIYTLGGSCNGIHSHLPCHSDDFFGAPRTSPPTTIKSECNAEDIYSI